MVKSPQISFLWYLIQKTIFFFHIEMLKGTVFK